MTRPQTMAAAFANCSAALANSLGNGNGEWVTRWRKRIALLIELIPSGGGIDRRPTHVDVNAHRIKFEIGFHHMIDVGFYAGWTTHVITIRPTFDGVSVGVSGPNRRDVKDYLREVMEHAFTRHVTWDEPAQRWIVESDAERYAAEARLSTDHRVNVEP